MNVLVINAGSSSLKYQLLNPATGDLLAKGLCERIGIDGKFTYKPQVEGKEKLDAVDVAMPTHAEAIAAVLDALVDPKNGVIASMKEIDAVGHRVVHGGEKFASSVVITDEVMAAIEECNPLAPLHNPANIIGIKACQEKMPGVPMVAVFDTAFHQTMPAKAYTYAIPYEYYENDKMRRYGFHGTSHRYVSQRCAEILGKPIEELKIVSCHLGNGSSITAIDGGKSVDTSMGLTPLAGLPMGTRSGDMDAGIMEFIMKKYDMSMADMMTTLNKAARDVMVRYRVHACTDVTGFGLMGHGFEMAQGSDVALHIDVSAIDLIPEALEFARMGVLPAGMYRNRSFAEAGVDVGTTELAVQDLLFDPQTSGGLLMAVDPADADALLAELTPVVPSAQRIGTVGEYHGGKRILLR